MFKKLDKKVSTAFWLLKMSCYVFGFFEKKSSFFKVVFVVISVSLHLSLTQLSLEQPNSVQPSMETIFNIMIYFYQLFTPKQSKRTGYRLI